MFVEASHSEPRYFESQTKQKLFSFVLHTINPYLHDETLTLEHLLPLDRLYASERSVIDHVITPSGVSLAAKTLLPYPRLENEEATNDPATEFVLLTELHGYDSFVIPYGIGHATDVYTQESFPTIYVEYINGVPLDEALYHHREGVASIDWFNGISGKLCAAIDHQHAKGIIHRDLSNGNILVQQNQIKIIDFGIAKKLAHGTQTLTIAESPIATAEIAPQEEFHGEISIKTDYYAVGVHHMKWLMGTTDPDAILNTISAMNHGTLSLPFSPHLAKLMEPHTLNLLWQSTQHLLARDPNARPDNLFKFRKEFTSALRNDLQLIRARRYADTV